MRVPTVSRMLLLMSAALMLLAACGKPRGSSRRDGRRTGSRTGTVGEGQLDIIAWPGYVERGESDKNYDWVTPFETATSCKVNVKTAGTSDEMVALMNQGGFDLVTASGDASLRLVYGNKVQAIDIARIPSYSERRSAPAGCAVAYRGRQALRSTLPVGAERADVQHQGVSHAADILERRT